MLMTQEVKRGDRVSLNVAKRPFYFQDGEFGIYLRAGDKEVAIIHEKATDFQLNQINHDIKNGHLVLGWAEKPPVEIPRFDSEIPKILEQGRNKISDWITALRDDKKAKHDVKVQQLEKIIAIEKEGKKRKTVIDIAEAALSYLGGVSSVEDTEQQKVEITLT